jgi:hypothetical protein
MKIVPAGPTIKQMEKQLQDCERQIKVAKEPLLSDLQEKAALLRDWVQSLMVGKWTS